LLLVAWYLLLAMLDIYWLEQTEADLPAEDDWLSENDSIRLNALRLAKRRGDWRLGRWTAKRALAACLNLPPHARDLAGIEICPAASGAPEAFVANQPAAVTISLSHRDGVAACAVALSDVALGCDLEIIEPRSDSFIADYFTTEEQTLLARAPVADQPRLVALLWSAKESALKALRTGLRLDTRSVIASPIDALRCEGENKVECLQNSALTLGASAVRNSWRPLHVQHERQTFLGWWQRTGNLIRTVVATPPPAPPVFLRLAA
jgi:4'-phosphopantetheinyl transferase